MKGTVRCFGSNCYYFTNDPFQPIKYCYKYINKRYTYMSKPKIKGISKAARKLKRGMAKPQSNAHPATSMVDVS